jgi:hypothetical protein
MPKSLMIYDFDGTLFHSPNKELGEQLYEKSTGKKWPFKGWWGRKESLSPPVVPEKPDQNWYVNNVVNHQKLDSADENSTVVLMTGRPYFFKNRIIKILKYNDMIFDHYFFSGQHGSVGSTIFEIKKNNLIKLMSPKYNVLKIWEDRPEHIKEFSELAKELKQKKSTIERIIIHDAVTGNMHEF